MTPEQFCHWLAGWVVVNAGRMPTSAQWRMLVEHLRVVHLGKHPQGSMPLQRTPEQFCYFLQGFVELNGGKQPTPDQWGKICAALETVFEKVTPPLDAAAPPPLDAAAPPAQALMEAAINKLHADFHRLRDDQAKTRTMAARASSAARQGGVRIC